MIVETSDSAEVQYPDGTVAVLKRQSGLWVEDVAGRAEQGVACAVGLVHNISGHPHDPDCEHCLRGRMRDKSKPHKSVTYIDQRGNTVYMGLMGPFEHDLSDTVYELTVLEGQYGWAEVTGIKDKSSAITAAALSELVRDVMIHSNQDPASVGRLHSDQGNEFKGEVKEVIVRLGAQHTDTGGYNSSTNPAEGAQGRLQQTARAMLVQCTGGHQYYVELRGAALKRAAYCINRNNRRGRVSAYEEAWGKPYEWQCGEEHGVCIKLISTLEVK